MCRVIWVDSKVSLAIYFYRVEKVLNRRWITNYSGKTPDASPLALWSCNVDHFTSSPLRLKNTNGTIRFREEEKRKAQKKRVRNKIYLLCIVAALRLWVHKIFDDKNLFASFDDAKLPFFSILLHHLVRLWNCYQTKRCFFITNSL